jgi:hypothetical protein
MFNAPAANMLGKDEASVENRSGKRASATMLYAVLGIMAMVLFYNFAQAIRHTAPNTVPHEVMHPK